LARRCASHSHDSIAIKEELDGKWAEWMEKVSDEQHQANSTDKRRVVAINTPSEIEDLEG
jgi:hypothetical protein